VDQASRRLAAGVKRVLCTQQSSQIVLWADYGVCAQPRIPMVEGLEQKLGVSMPDLESPEAKDFLLDLVRACSCALCMASSAAGTPQCQGVAPRSFAIRVIGT
jgi:hypothetical protein